MEKLLNAYQDYLTTKAKEDQSKRNKSDFFSVFLDDTSSKEIDYKGFEEWLQYNHPKLKLMVLLRDDVYAQQVFRESGLLNLQAGRTELNNTIQVVEHTIALYIQTRKRVLQEETRQEEERILKERQKQERIQTLIPRFNDGIVFAEKDWTEFCYQEDDLKFLQQIYGECTSFGNVLAQFYMSLLQLKTATDCVEAAGIVNCPINSRLLGTTHLFRKFAYYLGYLFAEPMLEKHMVTHMSMLCTYLWWEHANLLEDLAGTDIVRESTARTKEAYRQHVENSLIPIMKKSITKIGGGSVGFIENMLLLLDYSKREETNWIDPMFSLWLTDRDDDRFTMAVKIFVEKVVVTKIAVPLDKVMEFKNKENMRVIRQETTASSSSSSSSSIVIPKKNTMEEYIIGYIKMFGIVSKLETTNIITLIVDGQKVVNITTGPRYSMEEFNSHTDMLTTYITEKRLEKRNVKQFLNIDKHVCLIIMSQLVNPFLTAKKTTDYRHEQQALKTIESTDTYQQWKGESGTLTTMYRKLEQGSIIKTVMDLKLFQSKQDTAAPKIENRIAHLIDVIRAGIKVLTLEGALAGDENFLYNMFDVFYRDIGNKEDIENRFLEYYHKQSKNEYATLKDILATIKRSISSVSRLQSHLSRFNSLFTLRQRVDLAATILLVIVNGSKDLEQLAFAQEDKKDTVTYITPTSKHMQVQGEYIADKTINIKSFKRVLRHIQLYIILSHHFPWAAPEEGLVFKQVLGKHDKVWVKSTNTDYFPPIEIKRLKQETAHYLQMQFIGSIIHYIEQSKETDPIGEEYTYNLEQLNTMLHSLHEGTIDYPPAPLYELIIFTGLYTWVANCLTTLLANSVMNRVFNPDLFALELSRLGKKTIQTIYTTMLLTSDLISRISILPSLVKNTILEEASTSIIDPIKLNIIDISQDYIIYLRTLRLRVHDNSYFQGRCWLAIPDEYAQQYVTDYSNIKALDEFLITHSVPVEDFKQKAWRRWFNDLPHRELIEKPKGGQIYRLNNFMPPKPYNHVSMMTTTSSSSN